MGRDKDQGKTSTRRGGRRWPSVSDKIVGCDGNSFEREEEKMRTCHQFDVEHVHALILPDGSVAASSTARSTSVVNHDQILHDRVEAACQEDGIFASKENNATNTMRQEALDGKVEHKNVDSPKNKEEGVGSNVE